MWIARREPCIKEGKDPTIEYKWTVHEIPPGKNPIEYYAIFLQNYGQENVKLLEQKYQKITVNVGELHEEL